MKLIMRNCLALIGILLLLVIFGCAGMESFKTGEQLSKNNRWDEAIVYFEKAVKENPASRQYQEKLTQARSEAAKAHYERARQKLASNVDPGLFFLDQVLKEANRAGGLDPGNKVIQSFCNSVESKKAGLLAEIKTLYLDAESDLVKEDWMSAITKLRRINGIFSGYEDTGDKLARAEEQGARFFYKQGLEFSKEYDWKMASQAFKTAMNINPDFLDVRRLYQDAISKDNVNYYIKEGNKALSRKDLEKSFLFYERALECQPDNEKLANQVESLKVQLAKQYFDEAVKFTRLGVLNQACNKIELARAYSPIIQDGALFNELIDNISYKLLQRSNKYLKQKMWGNALVWLQKLEVLNPDNRDLFNKTLEAKDGIMKRIKKSIAVFDFGTPSNNEDAGKIVSNKLIAFLHTNASGDVRIIERENLQSILREMQLGQTGLVDVKSAQAAKMRGIDTFILGDVLQYSVNSNTHRSSKQVKVVVDTEMIPNPDFTLWLLQHPKASAEDWKNAPAKEREKKNYQLISYNAGVTKISSLIEIAYKLVDTSTGENLSTDTTAGKLIKEDRYQDEVPMANIPYDALDLPSELEVLDELSNAKAAQVGQNVLKHFQSLEVEYFNEAQVQVKRRRYEQAVEKFMDAIFDEKLKRITTPITLKSQDIIEKLTQNK